MSSPHVKTGDEVIVIAGSDRGKRGKVLQVFPQLQRVVVEGVRLTKRHLKPRSKDAKGRIIEMSMPIHISNVQHIAADGKPTRRRSSSPAV